MTDARPAGSAGRTRPFVGRRRELAALTTHLDSLAGGVAVGLSGAAGVGKTRLLTEFARIAAERGLPVVTTGPTDDPRRLWRAAPVVVVDDVHRADRQWLAAAAEVLATPPARPTLLVLASRLDDTVGPAESSWRRASVFVDALSPREIDELSDGRLSGWRRLRAYDDSDGVPGHLDLLVDQTRGSRSATTTALLAEVAKLPPPARATVRAAALLDRPADPQLLAEVADLSPAAVRYALGDPAAVTLIRPAMRPGTFELRHPVLAQAIRDAVRPAWRSAAQARAITALRARGEPPARYADHLAAASRPGDAMAAGLLAAAALSVEDTRPWQAADWYRAATRLLSDRAAPHLLAALARTALRAGRLDDCRDALRRRAAITCPDADTIATEARLSQLTGDPATGSAPTTADRRIHVLLRRAAAALAGGDMPAGRAELAEVARLMDRRPPDVELMADVGWLYVVIEDHAAALRWLHRGAAVGWSTRQWFTMARCLAGLGTVCLAKGDLDRALGHARRALELCEGKGTDDLTALVLGLAGDTLLARGEVDAARTLLTRPISGQQLAMVRAAVLLAAGDTEASVRQLADVDRQGVPAWSQVRLAAIRCDLSLATGRPTAASRAAARAWADRLGIPGQSVLADLVAAKAATNPMDKLLHATQAAAAAQAAGRPLDAAMAEILTAQAATSLNQAERHLRIAEQIAARCGARPLLDAVAMARAAGRPGSLRVSRREFQVVTLIGEGKTNLQIARVLEISPKTVETHLRRIFGKLNVSSRAEVALLVGRSSVTVGPERGSERR